MRAALLLLALAFAACGDDTSTTPLPDLSIACPPPHVAPAHDCCVRGIGVSQACTVVGDYCSGFEVSCTCGANLVWTCRNPSQTPDLAMPIVD